MPSPPNKADITENAHLAGAEFNIACALPGQSLALRFKRTQLDLPSYSRLIGQFPTRPVADDWWRGREGANLPRFQFITMGTQYARSETSEWYQQHQTCDFSISAGFAGRQSFAAPGVLSRALDPSLWSSDMRSLLFLHHGRRVDHQGVRGGVG